MASTPTEFFISRQDANKQATGPYPNSSLEHTFLSCAANIAIALLEQEPGRQGLMHLALLVDEFHFQKSLIPEDAILAEKFVDDFLQKIGRRFPKIVVDGTMDNVGRIGEHTGVAWEGGYDMFEPWNQSVRLNESVSLSLSKCITRINVSQIVLDMVALGLNSPNASQKSQDARELRNSLLLFAFIFVREVGAQMFITYLTQGMGHETPEDIFFPPHKTSNIGASGRYLKDLLFGGVIESHCDLQKRGTFFHEPVTPTSPFLSFSCFITIANGVDTKR